MFYFMFLSNEGLISEVLATASAWGFFPPRVSEFNILVQGQGIPDTGMTQQLY